MAKLVHKNAIPVVLLAAKEKTGSIIPKSSWPF